MDVYDVCGRVHAHICHCLYAERECSLVESSTVGSRNHSGHPDFHSKLLDLLSSLTSPL